jgi:putative peptidoglycan binding protein
MKRILFAVCIGTLALSVGALAETKQERAASGGNKGRRAAVTTATRATGRAHVQQPRQFTARQHASGGAINRQQASARTFNRQQAVSSQTGARSVAKTNRTTARERNVRRAQINNNNTAVTRATTGNQLTRRQALRQERVANANSGINRNVNVNRTRNVNRNVTLVNNWRGERFAGRNYSAFRDYRRSYHDRSYWRNHYDRLILVGGGWYFWNSGYWYPAWGYNPGYSYPYDGPIYGYGDLTPDQVVINVQVQLRDAGYYAGAVDGVLGPQTRYALAAFQADNGLAVTSAVDEPTLATLGLV